jgi:hypothetical protein
LPESTNSPNVGHSSRAVVDCGGTYASESSPALTKSAANVEGESDSGLVMSSVTTSSVFALSQVARVDRYDVNGPEDWRVHEEWQRLMVDPTRWDCTCRRRMPSFCGRDAKRNGSAGISHTKDSPMLVATSVNSRAFL